MEILLGHSTLNKYYSGQMLSCCKKMIQQFSDLRNCIILLKSSAGWEARSVGWHCSRWSFSSKLFLHCHLGQYFPAFPMNHHYLESSLKQIHGPHFQSFWFITSRVKPERFYFQQYLSCCFWSRDNPSRSNSLGYCSSLHVLCLGHVCLPAHKRKEGHTRDFDSHLIVENFQLMRISQGRGDI